MTRNELVKKVAQDTGYNQGTIDEVLISLIRNIKSNLRRNEPTIIRGFGIFRNILAKAKTCRNMKTKEPIYVPDRAKPYFEISKNIISEVRQKVDSKSVQKRKQSRKQSSSVGV